MKKFSGIWCILLLSSLLFACGTPADGNSKTDPQEMHDTADAANKQDGAKPDAPPEADERDAPHKTVENDTPQNTNDPDTPQETDENGAPQEPIEKELALDEIFQGIDGCAVLYSPAQAQYSFFNEEMCRQRQSPYSTFKIVSALSGLQNGVISDERSTLGYDGTTYGRPEWNGDLTLEEAFQASCVWYFRKIIDAVGSERIQEELRELSYGNCDISQWDGSGINPGRQLNGFWLASSLKISPVEQTKVLADIFEGQSCFDRSAATIVKHIMRADESDAGTLYGKTGSDGDGEAWFVGFWESEETRTYFAVYLNDRAQKERVSGAKAKEIALEIFQSM